MVRPVYRAILAALCFVPIQSYACDCDITDPEEFAEHSKYVIVAELLAFSDLNKQEFQIEFAVVDVLKGAPPPRLTLTTNRGSDSCGIHLSLGIRYILFLRKARDKVNSCRGNGPFGQNAVVYKWYIEQTESNGSSNNMLH